MQKGVVDWPSHEQNRINGTSVPRLKQSSSQLLLDFSAHILLWLISDN